MRVLIVTSYFWPENFRINDLAVGLKERGHDITVLTNLPNYPAGRFYPGYGLFKKWVEYYQGIKVIRIPQIPRGKSKALTLALNYFSSALMLALLGPLFCQSQFDLILVPQFSPATIGYPAVLLKKIKSLPIMLWILDIWPESLSATGAVSNPQILGLVRRMVHYIYSKCDRILISSQGFRHSIEATGGFNGQIDYFPNWVEPEYLAESPQKDDVALPALPPGFRIMFAGNIGAAQDFQTVLQAADELREFNEIHWLILGDGRDAGWVESQVGERGLSNNFHLLGRYPADTMPAFFSQADAMLVTLKRAPIFTLTAPGKLQSYMACGKPIVAGLDGEGAELVVKSGSGLACPAESPTELARCVMALYRMSVEDRRQMGERGRMYCAEHFDRNKQFSKLEDIMRAVVEGKGVHFGNH